MKFTSFLAFTLQLACYKAAAQYPAFNGYGNNINNPLFGTSGSYYVRIQAPADYSDNISAISNPNAPSPLLVSNLVFPAESRIIANNDRLSDVAAFWGQFLAHDILITPGSANQNETLQITVPDCVFSSEDPCDGIHQNITIKRAISTGFVDGKRAIVNQVTAFVDASQVYGADDARAKMLRKAKTPFLRTQDSIFGPLLPAIPVDGNSLMAGKNPRRFLAGDVRGNENPALQSLHTLFVREHNRKAQEIMIKNPRWDSDKVFQEARKWVIAVMQKITYDEYLTAILGEPLPPYTGYDANMNPGIDAFFMAASFRYGHSAVSPFILRLTETGEQHPYGHLLLRNVFFNPMPVYEAGIDPILRGIATQVDSMVDAIITDEIRKFFFDQPFDLVAVNTMRGRDVGIPTYNDARVYLGLPRASSWSDITADQDVCDRLREAYGDIDLVDAYVGGLAEDHVPNSILGPLFHASIKEQFTRLRSGDRYWYEGKFLQLPQTDIQALKSMSFSQLVLLNTQITSFPDSAFRVPNVNEFSFLGDISSTPSPASATPGVGSVRIVDGYTMSWQVVGDSINITLRTNSTGWFAIGFGDNGMNDADMIICSSVSNQFTCLDYWSTSSSQPPLDKDSAGNGDLINVQDLTQTEPYNAKVMNFMRKRNTGDSKDKVIGGKMKMIYARGKDDVLAYHGASRGAFVVDFDAAGSSSFQVLANSDDEEIERKQLLYFVFHGVIMFVCFFILAPFAIFSARYPSIVANWLEKHEKLMHFATHVAVMDIIIVVISSSIRNRNYDSYPHARIGYSLCGLLVMNVLFGHASKQINVQMRSFFRTIRKAHQFVGWVTFSLALANCCYGLQNLLIFYDTYNVASISLAVVAAIILACLGIFDTHIARWISQRQRTSQKNLSKSGSSVNISHKHNLASFSWEEVQARVEKGSHWIVIDGFIYDVDSFRAHHPGGNEVLNAVYGLDATNIYDGADSLHVYMDALDPATGKEIKRINKKKYAHSRVAVFELRTLATGIVKDPPVSNISGNVIFSPHQYIRLKLVGKTQDTETVCKFVFEFPEKNMKLVCFPGYAIMLRLIFAGKVITRLYSPVVCKNEGTLELFIKIYEEGMFTGSLNKYPIGSEIFMRGPFDLVPAALSPVGNTGKYKKIGLIGAGTGLAPMLLFLDYYTKNNQQSTDVHLLVICRNEKDIIAYNSHLSAYLRETNEHLKITFLFSDERTTIDALPNATVFKGRLNRKFLMESMPTTTFVSELRKFKEGVKKSVSLSSANKNVAQLAAEVSEMVTNEVVQEYPRDEATLEENGTGAETHPYSAIIRSGGGGTIKSKKMLPRTLDDESLRIFISGPFDFNEECKMMLQEVGYISKQVVILSNAQSVNRIAPESVMSSGVNKSFSSRQ